MQAYKNQRMLTPVLDGKVIESTAAPITAQKAVLKKTLPLL